MMIRFAAPALLALSCAAPALAAAEADPHAGHSTGRAADAPADAAAEPEAPEEKERKVCRMEKETGSNFPKRVCRTVAQMEADQRAAEQFRDRQNRMGNSGR
jgi:hypothetical protein